MGRLQHPPGERVGTGLDKFDLEEPADWPDGSDEGYEAIHRDFIEPIERAHALSLRITTAIANVFGAHG